MINKRMFFFSLVIVLALITACMDLPETIDEKTSAKSMDKAPLTKVCQGTTSSNVTESSGHHITVADNSYCSHNRSIVTGWL